MMTFKSFLEAKYDPPHSGEKLRELGMEHLLEDPIHKWRAETGIEMIHPEPEVKENIRIWKNWNLMTDNDKEKSDKKSLEIFGLTNKEHHLQIIREMDQKDFRELLSLYRWGIPDGDLNRTKDFKKYKTLSPEDFHAIQFGTCWDYVEAQRDYYTYNELGGTTYYIEGDNEEKASHTIFVYEQDSLLIWDEKAWKNRIDLHTSKSLFDLLEKAVEWKKEEEDLDGVEFAVFKYDKPPYGLSTDEFTDWIHENGEPVD